ncbi:MAG: hypothetical protein O3B09_04150 [Proteobacteria bacterium]|nr:hypothetical protein [Pseudomonadota bacterium]
MRYIVNGKKLIIIAIFFLQSCASFKSFDKAIDCSTIDEQISLRYSLFDELKADEIKRREAINVDFTSSLDQLSVVSLLVEQLKHSPENSNFISVDLRHYNNVSLGGIIISDIASDASLKIFQKTSKFSQGFFALINFGEDKITILPPFNLPDSMKSNFKKLVINRSDLNDAEILFNVSNVNLVNGNIKFTARRQVSIIADHVTQPYSIDIREVSNVQYRIDDRWIMPLYSISGSALVNGKITTGLFKFVNNKDVKEISLNRFDKVDVSCYAHPHGLRLE